VYSLARGRLTDWVTDVVSPLMRFTLVARQARSAIALSIGLVAMMTVPHAASDPEANPIWVENLSPLSGLVALPAMRTANVKAGWKVDTHVAIASQFVVDQKAGESVFFDGETTRATLALEYGWSADWSLRLSLPWVSQDPGFLDGVINDWHQVFGMPDGGRTRYPNQQLSYRYSNGNQTSDLLQQSNNGVGDVRLELNHALYRAPGQVVSVSLGYKAPTGDEGRLTGSGESDVFAALRFSGDHLSDLPLTWHGQMGYTYAGRSELLGSRQKQNLWFLGLGLDWQIAERWSLLAQYDAHAGIIDSDIDALGATPAGMLSAGIRWRPSSQWAIDASFIEDVVVSSAPDVTFQATLRWTPN